MEMTNTADIDAISDRTDTEASSDSKPYSTITTPPTVALVGRTRQEEARLAVATAVSLLSQGVSPSDIVITTANVDRYEDALRRAAKRYEHTVSVWTPLRLKRTVAYQFVTATLNVLAKCKRETIAVTSLAKPLRFGWVPVTGGRDPLGPEGVNTVTRKYADTERSVSDWQSTIATADFQDTTKRHWIGYLNWLDTSPATPSPRDVSRTFNPLLEAYDEVVLPDQPGEQSVTEFAETLRGFDRTIELVDMARKRYARWLSEGRVDRQWHCVRDLLESFASTIPGRRDLPTAAALDVKAANDTWALEVPYVIAIGLVDGEWPSSSESLVPPAAQARFTQSNGQSLDGLRPHSSWTTARDHDHFVSAVDAASELLIVTRYATDADGVKKRPSRFITNLEAASVSDSAQSALIADPKTVPDQIATHLSRGDDE